MAKRKQELSFDISEDTEDEKIEWMVENYGEYIIPELLKLDLDSPELQRPELIMYEFFSGDFFTGKYQSFQQ